MLFYESFLPGAIFGSDPRLHQAVCRWWDKVMYSGMAQLLQIVLHWYREEEKSRTHTEYSYIPALLTGTCKVWIVVPRFWKYNSIRTNIGTKLGTKIGAIWSIRARHQATNQSWYQCGEGKVTCLLWPVNYSQNTLETNKHCLCVDMYC